jgi:tetratricopeptide (TPR) repeat protein
MERRMLCLDGRLANFSSLTAALVGADPTTLAKAGGAAESLAAVSDCGRAKEMLDLTPPPRDSARRMKLDELTAALAAARTARTLGRTHEAILEATRVASESEAVGYDPLLASSNLLLGQTLPIEGELDLAVAALYRAVTAARAGGAWDVEAQAWISLANAETLRRRRLEAERLFALAEAAVNRLSDPGGRLLELYRQRGYLRSSFGDGPAAIVDLRAAVAAGEKAYGKGSYRVGSTWRALGDALAGEQRRPEAEQAYRQALALLETNESGRAWIAATLISLAQLLIEERNYDEARRLLGRAVSLGERPGAAPLTLASPLNVLGLLERKAGNQAVSLATLQRAEEVIRPVAGMGRFRADCLREIGWTRIARGELPEAETAFEAATALSRASVPKGDPELAGPLIGLGLARARLGHRGSAANALDEALALLAAAEAAGATLGSLADAFDQLGRALWEADHRRGEAVALVRRARQACPAPCSDENAKTLDAWLATHTLPTVERR